MAWRTLKQRLIRAVVPLRFSLWASGVMIDSLDRTVTTKATDLRRASTRLERAKGQGVASRIGRAEEAVQAAQAAHDKAVRQRDELFAVRSELIAKKGRR